MLQYLRLKVKKRFQYAKQLRLCFSCLQPYVGIHTCSNQVCRQCQNKNLTLLHINVHTRRNNRGSTNRSQSADAKGSPTAELNTYCSFKGKPQSQIFLATAIVELRKKSGHYVQCRALLDRASQSHFITKRCV